MIIKSITGMEVLDSRGMPTVYARVQLENGICGEATVPSGASVGAHEAAELRDGGSRLGGKGVLKAVSNVNTFLANKLCGKNFSAQAQLDDFLRRTDDTENKSWMGANAILAVSMAAARAFAADIRIPLYEYLHSGTGKYIMPMPMMNILNGGVHAANNVDIQEFMAVPVGAASFREAMVMGMEVYMALKARLRADGLSTAVGDEGGFAPDLGADEEAIEYTLAAARDAGLERDIAIALDVAASEWQDEGVYTLPKSGRTFTREAQAERMAALIEAYPIVSIEDPMAEDDLEGFALLAKATDIQIVGDDLFVTNAARIKKGIQLGIANSILIKLNQIGTVYEAQTAIAVGREAGYRSIISHRSGETEDTFIADFAVGSGAGQIKTGAPARGERTAKYNRLLRIEHELGSQCVLWRGFGEK